MAWERMIQATWGLTSYLSHLSYVSFRSSWAAGELGQGTEPSRRLSLTSQAKPDRLYIQPSSVSAVQRQGWAHLPPSPLPEKPVFYFCVWFPINPPWTETQRLSTTEPGSLLILAEIRFWPLGHQIKAKRGVIFIGFISNTKWKTLKWVKLEWLSTCSVHGKGLTTPCDNISLCVPHSLAPQVYLKSNSSPG